MNIMSLKIPDALAVRLVEAASQRGTSKSALVREAIRAFLRADEAAGSGPILSSVADLAGAFPGPADLSVNKAYLEGLGE